MRRSSLLPALALSLVAGLAGSAAGDEVLDQLELARGLYEQGDFTGAATELEFALQALRRKAGGQLAAAIPAAPAGWTADEVEQEAGAAAFMGGSMLSRAYRETGGAGRITLQIIANSPMVQSMAAMFSSPAIMASQPGTERIRVGRDSAMLQWDESQGTGELTLVVGAALIQLEGSGLVDSTPLVDLLKAVDFDKIRELAG
jgi:hypothetical protein